MDPECVGNRNPGRYPFGAEAAGGQLAHLQDVPPLRSQYSQPDRPANADVSSRDPARTTRAED